MAGQLNSDGNTKETLLHGPSNPEKAPTRTRHTHTTHHPSSPHRCESLTLPRNDVEHGISVLGVFRGRSLGKTIGRRPGSGQAAEEIEPILQ